MADRTPLNELCADVVPSLVSWETWGDASFVNLPIVYPSGSFVTVRLNYIDNRGIRVSDSGFAFREIESFGAERSFSRTAKAFAEAMDVEVGRRSIYVDVFDPNEVQRAIFDVSSASKAVAERIVSNVAFEGEVAISELLHTRLDILFPKLVEHDGKIVGASSTEWDVTALAKLDGRMAVFQAVSKYPVSVYKASTAFHDLAALDNPPALISVVSSKSEMGSNYSILAQAGKVIEIGQSDDVFSRAVAA